MVERAGGTESTARLRDRNAGRKEGETFAINHGIVGSLADVPKSPCMVEEKEGGNKGDKCFHGRHGSSLRGCRRVVKGWKR